MKYKYEYKDTLHILGRLGTIFAVVLSWTKFHAFWWAFLHGTLGWVYVIYYFCKGY